MSIDSEEELEALRRAGSVVAQALTAMRERVAPGVTTAQLDAEAERVILAAGARPAPRELYGFPGVACISVNDQAVHGVPGDRALEPGDVVTLDVTVELDGFYADAAITVGVPPISPRNQALIECAEAAFWKGMEAVRAGRPLARIGGNVEEEVERRGFRVLRELCGHGIGRRIHEEPQVLNFYEPLIPTRLAKGLVLAVEPIVSDGRGVLVTDEDGWTVRNVEGGMTAHFEHTIVVTDGDPIILTA